MRLKKHAAPSLFVLFLIFLSHAYPCRAADVDKIVSDLQKKYESITTIKAAFTQKTFSKALNRTEVTEGVVYLKKPGMMRWNYRKGSQDELVSNGRRVWLYQADLKQAIVRPAADQPDIARDFLSGVGNLRKDFEVRLSGEDKKTFRLELVPKRFQPGIKRLSIEVDKKSLLVVKTVVEDPFGNVTTVILKDIELNTPLEDSLFEFSAPKGVKVLRSG